MLTNGEVCVTHQDAKKWLLLFGSEPSGQNRFDEPPVPAFPFGTSVTLQFPGDSLEYRQIVRDSTPPPAPNA